MACEWFGGAQGFRLVYHYIDATAAAKLGSLRAFMDSLSYRFDCRKLHGSAADQRKALSPRESTCGCPPRHRDPGSLRQRARVWRMGRVHGDESHLVSIREGLGAWFLGRIFWYDPPGPAFRRPD